MPKWMDGIANLTPGRSLGAGLVLGSVNSKNLVVGLAAAATIASSASSRGQQIGASTIFVLIASWGLRHRSW
jgi:hypothetical protein